MPFVLLSSDGTQRADTEPLRAPRVRVALKPLDNGVAVSAVDAAGTLRPIGWLDAAVAEAYRRVLAPLADAGMYGTCIAETVPDGTVLRLGPAETCLAGAGWRTPADDEPDVDPNAVTAALPRAGGRRPAPVVALPGATPSGVDLTTAALDPGVPDPSGIDPSVIGTSRAARFRAAGADRAAWRRTAEAEADDDPAADPQATGAATAPPTDPGTAASPDGGPADRTRARSDAPTVALAAAGAGPAADPGDPTAPVDDTTRRLGHPAASTASAAAAGGRGADTPGPGRRSDPGQTGRGAVPRVLAAVVGLLMVAALAQALTAGSAGGGVLAAADQDTVAVPGWTGPGIPAPGTVAAATPAGPPPTSTAPRRVAAPATTETPPAPSVPPAPTGSAPEPAPSGSSDGDQPRDERAATPPSDQPSTDDGNQTTPPPGNDDRSDDGGDDRGGDRGGDGRRDGHGGDGRGGGDRGGRSGDRSFSSCFEAWLAGAAPMRRGEPGYSRRLDLDGDGTACERF